MFFRAKCSDWTGGVIHHQHRSDADLDGIQRGLGMQCERLHRVSEWCVDRHGGQSVLQCDGLVRFNAVQLFGSRERLGRGIRASDRHQRHDALFRNSIGNLYDHHHRKGCGWCDAEWQSCYRHGDCQLTAAGIWQT